MMHSAPTSRFSTLFWLSVLVVGIAMEAIALYFQYGLGYGPCVLCIHVRIYVAAFLIAAVIALATTKNKGMRILTSLAALGLSVGMTERAWQTFAVERGLVEDACGMDSGLPDWFALDKWLPTIFEPWEPCGYTPELLFGITMAEGLLALSALAIIASLALLLRSFR